MSLDNRRKLALSDAATDTVVMLELDELGNLVEYVESLFRDDEARKAAEDARETYMQSPILSLGDMGRNLEVLQGLRKRFPTALERALHELPTGGHRRVLYACAETDPGRRLCDRELKRIADSSYDSDEKEKALMDIHWRVAHLHQSDGSIVRMNGLELAQEYPSESAFVGDFLLETPFAIKIGKKVEPYEEVEYQDPYKYDSEFLERRFKGYALVSELRSAYGVDVLRKGAKLEAKEVARRMWEAGVKSPYHLACHYAERSSPMFDTFVLGRYAQVMSPQSRKYLRVEHPDVHLEFLKMAPVNLPPSVFLNSISETLKESGTFGDSPNTKGLLLIQKFVLAAKSFLEHGDVTRLFFELTGDEPEGDPTKAFSYHFRDHGLLKAHGNHGGFPFVEIRTYWLGPIDRNFVILEDIKSALGVGGYEREGYLDVEQKLLALRNLFVNSYRLLKSLGNSIGAYGVQDPVERIKEDLFQEDEERLCMLRDEDPVIYGIKERVSMDVEKRLVGIKNE